MLCMVPLETTLECPEVGLNDNLQPFSIKGTPAEIFRPPIFANTIFSQSSNLGGGLLSPIKGWRVFTHSQGWEVVRPFWGLGVITPPIWAWWVVSPHFGVGWLLANVGCCQTHFQYWRIVSRFWGVGVSGLHQPHFIQGMHFSQ